MRQHLSPWHQPLCRRGSCFRAFVPELLFPGFCFWGFVSGLHRLSQKSPADATASTCPATCRNNASLLPEEILIQPLELDRPVASHANAVLDHQVGQLLPVDEDHPLS